MGKEISLRDDGLQPALICIPGDSIGGRLITREVPIDPESRFMGIVKAIEHKWETDELPIPKDKNGAEISRGEKNLRNSAMTEHRIKLAWVLRIQTKSFPHDDPLFSSFQYRAWEAEGRAWNALFDLCFELFEALGQVSVGSVGGYRDSGVLFEQVITEKLRVRTFREKPGGIKAYTKALKKLRGQLDELIKDKSAENPYDPEKYRHQYNLFNLCQTVAIAQKGDNNAIKKSRRNLRKAYQAYTKAVGDAITDTLESKNFSTAHVRDDGQIEKNEQRVKGRPAVKIIGPSHSSKRQKNPPYQALEA